MDEKRKKKRAAGRAIGETGEDRGRSIGERAGSDVWGYITGIGEQIRALWIIIAQHIS